MATVKTEMSSREPSVSPQLNSPSQTSPQTPLQVPVPSFIQVEDGGLVAGCSVPAKITFGPYKGSIRKLGTVTEDGEPQKAEPTGFKLQDSTGQEYAVHLDKAEREQPWWTCIKHTTKVCHADITLFSKGNLLYLKTLKQIPQGKELQLIVTPPTDSAHNLEDSMSTSDVSGITPPVSNGSSPPAKHPHIPTNGVLLEGPPFKCTFCCIEFRNPSNLDAHRVYYCPGTATKPLPISRRRTNASTQITALSTSITRGSPQPETPPKSTITKEIVNTFVCQLCQSSFESESNCESHMLLLHCDESANLCKFCSFIGENRDGLCRHVFSHVKVVSVETSEKTDKADCDEKENRFNLTTGKNTNKPQNDSTQFASVAVARQVQSSAGSQSNVSASHIMSAESSTPVVKAERLGVVEMSDKDPKSGNFDKVEAKLPEKHLLACAQCDFVTSKESVFMKHTALHNSLQRKVEARNQRPDVQVNAEEHVDSFPSHPDTKCHECNIVFMSKKNYIAHKQYYCASRHADSPSPVATRDWDVRNEKPSTGCTSNKVIPDQKVTKTSLISSDRPQMPCSSKSASPHCLPCDTPEATVNHSPRNTKLSRTAQVSSVSSTPEKCPPFERQGLRMIHLDSDKPKFLPSSLVLQGPQLVLVTPIVIPQNLGSHVNLDNKLRIPQIKLPGSEQPLDLSTKPKTPPLMEIPETRGRASTASPVSMSQKSNAHFAERQGNRCEECEISFSKKESLVVHKRYYCKGRHMLTPRGLIRSVHYSPARSPTVSHNQMKREYPEQVRIGDTSKRSQFADSATLTGGVGKPRLAVHTVPHSKPPQNSNRSISGTPSPFSTSTPCPERASANSSEENYCTQARVLLRTPDLKRHVSPEETHSDKERSLPPIKRKRNLPPSDETTSPMSDSLSNGAVVKQEPPDTDLVQNHASLRSKVITTHPGTTEQNEHLTQNTSVSQSATLRSRNSTEVPMQITIKQEPRDSMTTSDGFSEEPRNSLQHSFTNGQNSPSSQTPNRPPVSAPPLTIPVYRRPASRPMTVRSYLNASKPLLRGVKPTVKHCRNCNISFSSLSTFIAHKKYYCASHHQSKTEHV